MKHCYYITALPGDGIGPEIMNQSYKIFDIIQKKFKIKIVINECKIGGDAIEHYGVPLPDKTLENCKNSDAILLGAVGGPKWKNLPNEKKPEIGALLALRKYFNLFANLRPIILLKTLKELSPLNKKIISNGFNILCVRELISDIYFGEPKGRVGKGNKEYAFDTAIYRRFEIEQIAHIAFQLAQKRKKHVTSIDKANVLQTSIFWREIVSQIAIKYPNIKTEHLYVDNASMQLISNPSRFDVILCPNLFGDILSDECAMLSGSIGMLPSASINKKNFGLYEPAGGSAPDIAKKNIANPIAQILSVALLFRYSLKLNNIAKSIEKSVYQTLKFGYRTQDISLISSNYKRIVSTEEMGSLIASLISV